MFDFNPRLKRYQLVLPIVEATVTTNWLTRNGCKFNQYYRTRASQVVYTFQDIPNVVVRRLNNLRLNYVARPY